MTATTNAAIMNNELLASLPRADARRLLAVSERIELSVGDQLLRHGEASAFIYFPVSGAVALMGSADGHAAVAVGLVGCEGILGAHMLLGIATSPLEARVLCAGEAWRVSRAALHKELAHSSALRLRMSRYLVCEIELLGRTAACMLVHQIAARLACWLLMCNDCARGESFHVTHELLAVMLGVRRVSVTVAAVAFQRNGLIQYHRGEFTVLDLSAFSLASCACYADAAHARQLFKLRR
jgi:CRP-like cAMP-binding protein